MWERFKRPNTPEETPADAAARIEREGKEFMSRIEDGRRQAIEDENTAIQQLEDHVSAAESLESLAQICRDEIAQLKEKFVAHERVEPIERAALEKWEQAFSTRLDKAAGSKEVYELAPLCPPGESSRAALIATWDSFLEQDIRSATSVNDLYDNVLPYTSGTKNINTLFDEAMRKLQ